MNEKTAKRDRFDWRLPLCAASGALILFAPTMIYGNDTEVLYIFVAAPIISVMLLVVAISRRGMIAAIYAGLGDKNKAFEFLEKAYQERDSDLPYFLRSDLRVDNLRSDPRFEDLLRRMNFPH
jgi:hypothetical protein